MFSLGLCHLTVSLISNSDFVHSGGASGNGDGALGLVKLDFSVNFPLSMNVQLGGPLETVLLRINSRFCVCRRASCKTVAERGWW